MNSISQELYNIPIEKLGLSVRTLNQCLRAGVTSVGDCVDVAKWILFPEIYFNGMHMIPSLYYAMNEEVISALIKQGYLKRAIIPDDFSPSIIAEIKQKLAEQGINWQK
ncbi:MAG: DNA-directed RNA polymerase subunit alpha C-terminal domain-containing protein [Chloroflexota bacterium]